VATDKGRGVTDERLEAVVRGVVQGVGFRWFVVRRASELGLTGWTSNQSDGSVRVVAEGPSQALDHLLKHLNEGPSGAHVESVEAGRTAATGEFTSFTVRAGAHRGD
jgi:acylphosphatase